jgi:hypothetical protein
MILIMKSVYTLATLLAIMFFVNEASAQFVAVRSGNWNDDGAASVWSPSGKPPAVCNACTITINSGFTVNLNTSVTLANGSVLTIGSGGPSGATLLISASGGTSFATGNNLILPSDGSSPASQILLGNNISVLQAGSAGTYDGVLVSYSTVPVTYFKQVGTSPQFFVDQTPSAFGPAAFGTSLTGPVTLSSSGTLPIILNNFNAVLNKSDVELSWETAVEVNSDHFALQRLNAAATDWETIATLKAKGNSSTTVQYSFLDETPHAGVNEYRIKSVDRDGKFAISEIKVIHLGALDVKVFPNPASDYVNVNLSSTATGVQTIRLVTQAGQLLAERKVDNGAGTIVSMPVNSYPQGNYLIIVTGSDGTRQVSKLFISRF